MESIVIRALFFLASLFAIQLEARMMVEEVHEPEMPKFDIPELEPEVHVPEVHMPKLQVPEMPKLHVPEMPKLQVPEMPKLHVPEMPKLHVPEMPKLHVPEMPKLHIPEVHIPHESSSSMKGCKMNFSKLDYSPVTSVCKGPTYDMYSCCSTFSSMACKYSEHVNDFGTTCPLEFLSFLNLAGNYPHGVFVNRCVKGKQLCSTQT